MGDRGAPGWAVRPTRIAALLAATALAGSLAACGTTTEHSSRAHSVPEREWVDNTLRFLGTIDSDILLSTAGGANLATARRALKSDSAVYTMLVAYTFFGDCTSELARTGVPSARAKPVVGLIVIACRRLAHAAALFQLAMSKRQVGALVAAGSASLAVEPLVARARERLQALRRA